MLQDILKELRQKNNVTAKTVAEAIGIMPDTYRSYETGRREPNLKTLAMMADYFHVTTDFLLERAPQTDAMKLLVAQTDVSPETLVKQFEALPEEGQALMMAIIRALKETRKLRQAKEKPQFIQIRKHLNKAAAGFGYDLSSEDEWNIPTA